jgi:site-specific DNA recombinase
LNSDKVPPRASRGQGWRSTGLRQVMLNPIYKGTQVVGRYSHISDINKVDLSKAIQIPVPAIVSESLWQSAQDHLLNNKHIKPKFQEEFLLQGLITCGLCGRAYQTERSWKKRYYQCRGRLKSSHIDGSPRCQSPGFDALRLENELWQRIVDIMNDPSKLSHILQDSIAELKLREKELSVKIKPIDERLAQIFAQKAKLADDWVFRNMNKDKFQDLQQSLEKEEARLRAVRSSVDPAQIRELEESREKLKFWEKQLQRMVWNIENEDGSMIRLVDQSHEAVLKLVNLEDKSISHREGFPTSRRELLDKLQVRLVVMADRIEVKALFPIDPITCQLCTSGES